MYPTSDAYKTAVHAPTRESKVSITITTSSAKTINITDSNLIKDTLYIKNQCVNGSEFELGAVYAAECGFVFTSDIDRYELFNAAIQINWSLKTVDGWQNIPLGIFYIAEANRISNKITVKAYDLMTEFDVAFAESTSGTAYELLNYACMKCGIDLGNTQAEIEAMPNTDLQLFAYTEQLETYRDLLAYLSIMLCAFCTMGKDGKLYIVQYKTASELTIPKEIQKTGTVISDYETRFRGVVGRFMAEENYYPYEKYLPDTEDGLTLDLGDMPLYRGDNDVKYEILDNILNVLKDVVYTPSQFELLGDPSIELGDFITIGGYEIKTLITSYCWNYRKTETLTSAGSNPRLAGAESGVTKQISQLSNTVANSAVTIAAYTNSAGITINNTVKNVLSVDFSAAGGVIVLTGVVPYTASGDGHLKISYYFDDNLLAGGEIIYYTPTGKGAIPIQAHLSVTDRNTHTIKVEMCTLDELTEQRKIEARVFRQILDKSEEVITIGAAEMKIAILGRAMICTQSKWDGTITGNDTTKQSARLKTRTFKLADILTDNAEVPTNIDASDSTGALNTQLNTTIPTIAETVDYETVDT